MKRRTIRTTVFCILLTSLFWLADGGSDLQGLLREPFRENQNITYFTYGAFHYGLYHAGSLIVCVIPCGLLFCEEWEAKAFLPTLSRYGKNGYLRRVLLRPAINGGIVMAGGFLLYVLLLRTQIPFFSWNPNIGATITADSFGELLLIGDGFPYFLMKALFQFLKGLFFTGIAITISIYHPNSYVAAISGFAASRVFRALNKTGTLTSYGNPDLLLDGEIRFIDSLHTLFLALAVVVLAGIILTYLGRKGLEKRCEDGCS